MASASQAPRDVVAGLEARPLVPDGAHDRFSGYAVLGVRFESGDILALRRFPATSVGPGYTSVWHRSREGRWTMHQDVEVDAGCAKYFSAAVEATREASIRIAWTGADRFSVFVGGAEPIAWDLRLGASLASRTLGRLAAATPAPLLRAPLVSRALGSAAGALLGAGTLTLTGATPNGFRFAARPAALWLVAGSRACIGSRAAGAVVPNREEVLLGDVRIPRRGLFAIVQTTLQPDGQAVAGSSRG